MKTEQDFIAAMQKGIPPIVRPLTPPSDLPDLSPEELSEDDVTAELC